MEKRRRSDDQTPTA